MLDETISQIKPLDQAAMEKCQLRIDNLTKPLASLQSFEYLIRKIAGVTGNARPRSLKKSIVLMGGDHGVSAEGVSDCPQEVTAQMMETFCRGGAAINVFAQHVEADLVLVDIGVAAELPHSVCLHDKKVAYGTKNLAEQPAMTRGQALQAINAGIKIALAETEKGIGVLGLGEMGIAGTTAATAIVACYAEQSVAELTGYGTGVADTILNKKVQVIKAALAVNQPEANDPLDVLSKVGGFEIAGLAGVILGAAAGRAVIVLDGLVTTAAALIAVKLAPQVKDYLIGSHYSVEPAHKAALTIIDVPAYLYLDMRLGEGTGAAMGMSLINAALHVMNDMKTFGEAEVAVAQDGPGALKQSKDVRDE
ncbi:nicotinate-nucleotide--dimethylbenzimidazole phosphoribosyltransferase|uniref:Nicotinate-nucleotide--dimethylbenzimidazole phosphoribosyltransferase n=1 Tax=Dendrosporobacter quercicolus TaxID=146817 RepID=A0A1G9KG97_9FIRM|nr:nicotinate-nucleotide--dimethylbenzimidazole phosphoribosyltransferase [Dendrosporobacter quercicolus]NSL49746.1 nicotinate-nucleotide--dimethylbenzimidazole phosphoribosyltransferase [Dendrosporobacter quercicolus DSM 1736]SDL48721.1 nicotinate-nucleotide-dimethylbenzimidazole phosphoribosyltransferase [Dendrosporobacter quercicolus]